VALGFQPATGDQLEYLRVTSYPQDIHLKPAPRAVVAPPPPSSAQVLGDWLKQALLILSTQVAKWTTKARGV